MSKSGFSPEGDFGGRRLSFVDRLLRLRGLGLNFRQLGRDFNLLADQRPEPGETSQGERGHASDTATEEGGEAREFWTKFAGGKDIYWPNKGVYSGDD